jgi:alkanesulfonate monooxygenase SsuD/methylene tetrahydromethanopterin reductase-like flavin-dependent oxidoreductase (luciferase family)
LVWAMPLHHPLRLIEEICMLDQLSGGRLEIGFGRGSVPIELEYYGADPDDAQEVYAEAVEVVLMGMTCKVLHFHGKRFSFKVPMEIEPLQKPHPPVWYGVHAVDSAERAARRNLNVVSLDPPAETRLSIERYRTIWPQVHPPTTAFPKLGLGRFIVVAPTDAEALTLARRAYLVWHASFTHLFRLHGRSQSHPRPAIFDLVIERGQGVAGTPATVAEFLSSQLDATGCNYVVGQFAFGDLTLAECLRSIELFSTEVMPRLRANEAVGGEQTPGVAAHVRR